MSKSRNDAIREEAGYIWDTCHIILSKEYTGQLDERTMLLISNMGRAAENLLNLIRWDYES